MESVSLKEYVDVKFQDAERALEAALRANEKRLDAMNEFRNQLKDQANLFLMKDTYEARHRQLEEKTDAVQKLVFIGLGITIAIEFISRFIK